MDTRFSTGFARATGRLMAVALLLAPITVSAEAQEGTRIVGRVFDQEVGRPLAGAVIEVVGMSITATSGIDGRYTLLGVPPGEASLAVRAIGFQPKTITGLPVQANAVLSQDVALVRQAVKLAELTVSAEAERGTVSRALDEQRNSNTLMNVISSAQIERSPDGDASQAIQRVSGVTLQDRKYVIVRGLGERYTVTSLNGSRLPSPEPERKSVPLDLLPSNMLEGIATAKAFTPDRPGDFSGASVDLRTREFPAGRKYSFSWGVSTNTAALRNDVLKAPTEGMEWLGFAGSARQLPGLAFQAGDLTGLTDAELNQVIGSFRNVWTPTAGGAIPGTSLSLSVGGEDPVNGHLFGYAASLTYSLDQEVHAEEERALARSSANGVEPFNQHVGSSGRTSVLWGGMLNFTTRVAGGSKFRFNNSYTRSGDNDALRLVGDNEEFAERFLVTRQGFTSRSVRSNQLVGEHLLGNRHLIEWMATSSGVTRDEPDRTDLVYSATLGPDGQAVRDRWFGSQRSATKTFSSLKETGWDFSGSLRYSLGRDDRNSIKVGGAFRMTDRDVDSRAYDVFNRALTSEQRAQDAERIFDGEYAAAGLLTLFTNPNGGIYSAEDRIGAGFAQLELWFGKVQVIAGARIENARLLVDSRDPQGTPVQSRLENTDVLPALVVNVPVDSYHNLRFAASQTLARPEYRELSPVSYFEPLGGTITRGNPSLRRTTIRNFDARWEWYPASGQVISAGVFAKRFNAPIEKTYVGTTGAANLSFINADGAWNYGVELEARRNLRGLGHGMAPFTVFTNVTVMKSEITPGNDSISSLTSVRRPMVGQSEYVVNAGINYDQASGFTATLLYNVVGQRIIEAGISPLPDTYEKERHLLDASFQFPVVRQMFLRFDVKNLLDSPVAVVQGPVTRTRYRVGRSVRFGVRFGN